MADRPREALGRNGAWLVLPPLAVSLGLWGVLPPAYADGVFAASVPGWWNLTENVLRVLVFSVPAVLVFGASSPIQRVGWAVYAVGLAAYVASYLILALGPETHWATSAVGFTAPAWTPGVWLLGVAMVCQRTWLRWPADRRRGWRWWAYLAPVAAFLVAHVGHAGRAWGTF